MKLPAFLLSTLGVWTLVCKAEAQRIPVVAHQTKHVYSEPVEIQASGNRSGGAVVEYWLVESGQRGTVVELELVYLHNHFPTDCSRRFVIACDVNAANDADMSAYPNQVAARVRAEMPNEVREITRFCKGNEPRAKSSGSRMLVIVAFFEGTAGGIRLRAFAANPGLSDGGIVGIAITVSVVVAVSVTAAILYVFRHSVFGSSKPWQYQPR